MGVSHISSAVRVNHCNLGERQSVCVEKYDTIDTKNEGVKDDHKGRGNKKEGNMNGESSQDGNERGDNVESGESVNGSRDSGNADNEVENDPQSSR